MHAGAIIDRHPFHHAGEKQGAQTAKAVANRGKQNSSRQPLQKFSLCQGVSLSMRLPLHVLASCNQNASCAKRCR